MEAPFKVWLLQVQAQALLLLVLLSFFFFCNTYNRIYYGQNNKR